MRRRRAPAEGDSLAVLTKRHVAERLAVGVRTLERMVATSDLPAHRVDGQRRFLWSEVVAWVAAAERR